MFMLKVHTSLPFMKFADINRKHFVMYGTHSYSHMHVIHVLIHSTHLENLIQILHFALGVMFLKQLEYINAFCPPWYM